VEEEDGGQGVGGKRGACLFELEELVRLLVIYIKRSRQRNVCVCVWVACAVRVEVVRTWAC